MRLIDTYFIVFYILYSRFEYDVIAIIWITDGCNLLFV